jgi:carboxyl-terminal processing protease
MKKILMSALVGTLSGGIVVTQVAGPLVAQEAETEESVYQQLDLFGDIFERIRANMSKRSTTEDLVSAAINGMLTSLDPHSSYLSAKDFEDMQVETKGEFGGLGIEVTQEEGFIKVISPMDGTPAAKAGIKAGDFITHVNGEAWWA